MAGDREIDFSYIPTAEMPTDCFTIAPQKPTLLMECIAIRMIGNGLGDGLGNGLGIVHCTGIGNGLGNGLGNGHGYGTGISAWKSLLESLQKVNRLSLFVKMRFMMSD